MHTTEELPARIAAKITIHPVSGCWLLRADKNGYAKIWWQGCKDWAHRIVYRLLVGNIPDGWDVDHVADRGCISKACCNPAHLEAVPHRVNLLRAKTGVAAINAAKTECPKRHKLVPGNLVKSKLPARICLECTRERDRRRGRRRGIRVAA